MSRERGSAGSVWRAMLAPLAALLFAPGPGGCARSLETDVRDTFPGAGSGSGGSGAAPGGTPASNGGAPGNAGSAASQGGVAGLGGSATVPQAGKGGAGLGGDAGDLAGAGGASADLCPGDPNKDEPGACGCNALETDTDLDGTPNCTDQCPADPEKAAPGECGCGVLESCMDFAAGMLHRYSFTTAGATATDSVGTDHGTIVGVNAAAGSVTFNGTDDAYVNLPNGIVSSLTNATFELWFTWGGGGNWQRIFDFGTNDAGEGNRGTGLSYLYLTARSGDAPNGLRSSFTANGTAGEMTIAAANTFPTNVVRHLALVVDDTGNQLRLYVNSALVSSVAYTGSLSSINDVNNWLGRSNWNDPPLNGSIDEFRIYGAALTASQIAASQAFGPDKVFL